MIMYKSNKFIPRMLKIPSQVPYVCVNALLNRGFLGVFNIF